MDLWGSSEEACQAQVWSQLMQMCMRVWGGGWCQATSHGNVDKSPDIDWMQELLDTYVQTDPLKAQVRNQKVHVEDDAGKVVNVTKTYALPRERLYLPDSLIATWFTVHSNIQHWMTDCPARVYGCCRGTLCMRVCVCFRERERCGSACIDIAK